jgi:hypothetical protein
MAYRQNEYVRHSKWRPSEVLEETGRFVKNFDGQWVNMNSQRYELFKGKGCSCIRCGLEGTHFWLECDVNNFNPEKPKYHFNLYGFDTEGNEVLMTKDHILPKSRGGKNHYSNYQPMCFTCNQEKWNQTEEELKEKALIS